MKRLAIVILNYNSSKDTIKCITKLKKVNGIDKIVVVDNNSQDKSFAELHDAYQDDKLVEVYLNNKNNGYSSGNNFGIKKITDDYEYLAILNPDIIIEDVSFFCKLESIFDKDETVAVVSGIQIYAGKFGDSFINYWNLPGKYNTIVDHSFLDYLKKNKKKGIDIIDDYGYVDVLSGCCFVIKKSIFDEVNYFDENVFLYYEENILANKLKNLGYKEALCISTNFYHNHSAKARSICKIMKEKKIQMRSRKYYYKNYVNKNVFLFMIFNVFSIFDYIFTFMISVVYLLLK